MQLNIGHLDESGVYNGSFSTFALCGQLRSKVRTARARRRLHPRRPAPPSPWRSCIQASLQQANRCCWRPASERCLHIGLAAPLACLPAVLPPPPAWRQPCRPGKAVDCHAGRPVVERRSRSLGWHQRARGGLCHGLLPCRAAELPLSFPHPPPSVQGEADSALDHLWTKKRAEIGQQA